MSERLENAAETLKLARLIGLDADELGFLDTVPVDELRLLRERVTDSLFDAAGQAFVRLAAAAKLLPSPLVASVAERHFGPLLCARAAAAVDPAKAVDVAKRLSARFLADATVELDPRRVAAIIAGVPTELVGPVAAELGKRAEYVTMGRFLAFVSDAAIAAAMAELSDEAMLRTAFVLEHKDALDHAVGVLPPERMPGVLRCASEQDLWPEALDLLEHLEDDTRGPIAEVLGTLDDESIAVLVTAASQKRLWENLLPVVAQMTPRTRESLASRPAFHERGVLAEIIHAALQGRLWPDLLPLLACLPTDARVSAAEIVVGLDPDALAVVVEEVVLSPEALEPLVELLADLRPDERGRVLAVVEDTTPEVAAQLVRAARTPALAALLHDEPHADLAAVIDKWADRLGLADPA